MQMRSRQRKEPRTKCTHAVSGLGPQYRTPAYFADTLCARLFAKFA